MIFDGSARQRTHVRPACCSRAMMSKEVFDEWVRLYRTAEYGIVIKSVSGSSVSSNAQSAHDSAGSNAADAARGLCEVELWKVPRPADIPQLRPERVATASRKQGDELALIGAADQRNA